MEDNFENSNTEINNDFKPENYKIKKPNKKITIINFILIGTIFIGLFIYMLLVDGFNNIINLLKNVNYFWVLGGLICLLINWICDSLNIHIPLKKMYTNQTFKNSIKISMIGQLFNNITPFSSGGQPMQAYELTKTGKKISDSLSIFAIKFVITQFALVVTTFIVVLFQFDFFSYLMQNFLWVGIIGFILNILAILIVFIAGVNTKAITIFTTPILKFLGKIKIIKDTDKTLDKLNTSINNFSSQFKLMKTQKYMVIQMFIIASIQSLAYYSITYMVYKSFGNTGINFWQIIPIQAFLLLIMTFIPTPGSGLGAEGGFLLLFNSIFKEGTINMSILFWRLYTFYLPIIIGALFLIPNMKFNKKNKD